MATIFVTAETSVRVNLSVRHVHAQLSLATLGTLSKPYALIVEIKCYIIVKKNKKKQVELDNSFEYIHYCNSIVAIMMQQRQIRYCDSDHMLM